MLEKKTDIVTFIFFIAESLQINGKPLIILRTKIEH